MSNENLETTPAKDTGSEIIKPSQPGWRHAQASLPAVDVAEQLTHLEDASEILNCLDLLPLKRRAQVFDFFNEATQTQVAAYASLTTLGELLEELPADSAADLFLLLSPEQQAKLITDLPARNRASLEQLTSYAEDTVGAVMTSEISILPRGISVARALEILRHSAAGSETIYQTYIVDPRHHLVGVVSLRDLILARPSTNLDALMTQELISINAEEHQEEAVRLISKYDLLALPVVDEENRLVGIVTYDDAMDVAEEEATEDMHLSASITPLEEGLLTSKISKLYASRITWLVLLVFANLVSGIGIAFFEDTIAAKVALVFFMPLLIGSGGNAGAQASTLMVRGLAVGDVRISDWTRLLGRELLVAGALGLTMALAVAPIGIFRGGIDIALVVGLSMVIIVLFGSLLGMCLPFILHQLKWDPATASTPLVTTLADAGGVVTYFALATWLLGL